MQPEHKPILTEVERLEVLNWLASQERGMRLLQWLCHDICHYQVTSIGYEVGKLSTYATIFNEARKDIWRIIRPYLLPDLLARIECYDVLMAHEQFREQVGDDVKPQEIEEDGE